MSLSSPESGELVKAHKPSKACMKVATPDLGKQGIRRGMDSQKVGLSVFEEKERDAQMQVPLHVGLLRTLQYVLPTTPLSLQMAQSSCDKEGWIAVVNALEMKQGKLHKEFLWIL